MKTIPGRDRDSACGGGAESKIGQGSGA